MSGPSWHRIGAVYCALGGLAFATVAVAVSESAMTGTGIGIALHSFGALAIVVGALVWMRSSAPRVGQLILLCGTAYYLGDLRASFHPILFAVGFCLAYLWTAVFAHLALVVPSGRIAGRPVWALVVANYLGAVGSQVGRFVAEAPEPPWWWNMTPGPNTGWAIASSLLYVLLVGCVVLVIVHRWIFVTRLRRRHAGAMWAAAVTVAAAGIATAVAGALGTVVEIRVGVMVAALAISLLVIPAIVLARRINLEIAQGRAARIVLDIDQVQSLMPHPVQIQRALAEAVGDPTLLLSYPVNDGFVDVLGRPALTGPLLPGRAMTPVHRRGELVALIQHDETLVEQRQVAEAAVAVAGLSIENAHLYAVQQAQLEQLRRSRQRMSTAAYEERHRIQRDLHDGAQQQLYTVLLLLDVARHGLASSAPHTGAAAATVSRAHLLLHDAIADLRDLTQGIYPANLVEHGLVAVVEQLADVSPVPLRIKVPPCRWSRHVELTAYFLIAEALTNSYKHAEAGQVTLSVVPEGQWLVVEIADDGRGGALPRPGSGLSGLRDRVAAAGGSLTLSSPPGGGTSITAMLPLEAPCE